MLYHCFFRRNDSYTRFFEVLENLFEIADVSALSDDLYIAEWLLVLSDIKIAFNDENIVTKIDQL
jgi:hypothetical protein